MQKVHIKSVYLDYAATTPVDPMVTQAMLPYFTEDFGNPGSLHSFGQKASTAVFEARQTIAQALGAQYPEIIFTGSATEANNLALRGVKKGRIIISAIEHESILSTAKDLAQGGADVVIVPVNKEGVVDLKKLKTALNEKTVLVSVMYANNETGVIQPIKEIAEIIRNFEKSQGFRHPERSEGSKLDSSQAQNDRQGILFHTDAVQAFQYLNCSVDDLGVDLLTISAQKIYGPKGSGALYVRSKKIGVTREYPLDALVTGGGQEASMRSGTENVPGIVGFAKAVELVESVREKEAKRVCELRDYAWSGIKKIFPKATLNGSYEVRLHNNLNFYLPNISGEQMLVGLDLQGIAISSGSACTARSIDPSHVLLAMGFDKIRAKNSLRLTLGRPTTKTEIDRFLKTIRTFS